MTTPRILQCISDIRTRVTWSLVMLAALTALSMSRVLGIWGAP